MLKRLLDILITSLSLIFMWPLLIVIALAIRISSRSPFLFVQTRAGQGGRPFQLYKYRTMRMDVDPFGPSPRGKEDPRLTRIGRWLRETSLDELPQLFNILKGDMSLVGPRPLYVSQIEEWDAMQRRRLLVKPGLTGLAQTCGRGALTREEKLALDTAYVENRSLALDCQLMVRTLWQVCTRRGIYEERYSQIEETRGRRMSEPDS